MHPTTMLSAPLPLVRFLWHAVTYALLFAVGILAVVLLVIPWATGSVPLTILTGSMRPAIEPGAKVIVKPIDPEDVRIGHIITFQPVSGDPSLITHRVISVVSGAKGQRFITQGDNNGEADEPIKPEQIKGRVLYSVPFFGLLSDKVHNGNGPKYTRWAAFGLIGYGALLFASSLRRKPKNDTTAPRRRGQTKRELRASRRQRVAVTAHTTPTTSLPRPDPAQDPGHHSPLALPRELVGALADGHQTPAPLRMFTAGATGTSDTPTPDLRIPTPSRERDQ